MNDDKIVANLLEAHEYELGQAPESAKQVISAMLREAIAITRAETMEEAARNLWHGPNVQPCPTKRCDRLRDREYACAELRRMAHGPASKSLIADETDGARKTEGNI